MANDFASFSLKDYDGERSGMRVNTVEITAANIDAQVTALGTLRTTSEALMLQGWYDVQLTDQVYAANPSVTDPFSQREHKWVIIVEDTAGNVYKANEIPCADLAFLENGSKYIYKNKAVAVQAGSVAVNAFVAAYEATAKDNAGGALVVVDIYQAGRNI